MLRLLRRSPLAWWACTLTLAGLTGSFVARLVAEAEAAAARYGARRDVAVAVRPVAYGDTVEEGDVERRAVPAAFLPDDAVAADPVGQVAVVPVVPNEVFVESKLAPRGLRGVAALLPAGTRGVALPAGAGTRPPLERGQRVDVLVTFEGAGAAEPTFVVAAGVVVVDVDPGADTVTVAVPAPDAPRVAFAATAGAVRLALTGA